MSKLCTAYFVVTFDTARGKEVTSLELIFIILLHLFIFVKHKHPHRRTITPVYRLSLSHFVNFTAKNQFCTDHFYFICKEEGMRIMEVCDLLDNIISTVRSRMKQPMRLGTATQNIINDKLCTNYNV